MKTHAGVHDPKAELETLLAELAFAQKRYPHSDELGKAWLEKHIAQIRRDILRNQEQTKDAASFLNQPYQF